MAAPSAKDALLNMLNVDNGTSLTFTDISFSNPVVETGVTNTTLTVTPYPDSGLTGSKEIHYNRLPLSTLGSVTVNYANGAPINGAGIVDKVNSLKHINLMAEDIEQWYDSFTIPAGTTQAVTLSARVNSYAWIGNHDVSVTVAAPIQNLSNIITDLDLSGLTFP